MSGYNTNIESEFIWNGAGAQSLTVSSSAVALVAFTAATTHVLITINSNDVSVRFDGVDPTSSVGHFLKAGQRFVWRKGLAAAAKFIATGSNATVFATPVMPA